MAGHRRQTLFGLELIPAKVDNAKQSLVLPSTILTSTREVGPCVQAKSKRHREEYASDRLEASCRGCKSTATPQDWKARTVRAADSSKCHPAAEAPALMRCYGGTEIVAEACLLTSTRSRRDWWILHQQVHLDLLRRSGGAWLDAPEMRAQVKA